MMHEQDVTNNNRSEISTVSFLLDEPRLVVTHARRQSLFSGLTQKQPRSAALINERVRARVHNWRRLCPLGQKPCQKAEESFNGLKRESATMHSRTCMVGLRNLHGWTSQLAWLGSPTSMVQLLRFHPLTEKPRFRPHKTTFPAH